LVLLWSKDAIALFALSGSSLFRQSIWPSGQVLLKQGEQERDRDKISTLLDKGGVNAGSDEP